ASGRGASLLTLQSSGPGPPRRLLVESRLWLGGLVRRACRQAAKGSAPMNLGTPAMKMPAFREPGAAQAGGYVLALACLLVAVGLVFHPPPSGGFEEQPSVLEGTPWWAAIHIIIAAGFVLCVLGGFLMLFAGGSLTRPWPAALSWAAIAVGMVFFTGVALINGGVMHYLSEHGAPLKEALVYDAFNRLLIAYGWLGNPMLLVRLLGVAVLDV